jgi:hypothetical protein
MNLPQLTAEASLYQPRTQYRTKARTSLVGSSGRGMITTAQGDTSITVPGETITVHGTLNCPPGYEDQGGQCVLIGGGTLTTPSQTGGGTRGGTKGHGPSGGKKGNGLKGGNYNPSKGGICCCESYSGLSQGTYVYDSIAGGGWACSLKIPDGGTLEVFCNPVKGKSAYCADGTLGGQCTPPS